MLKSKESSVSASLLMGLSDQHTGYDGSHGFLSGDDGRNHGFEPRQLLLQ